MTNNPDARTLNTADAGYHDWWFSREADDYVCANCGAHQGTFGMKASTTAIAEPTDAEQRAYRLGFLRATHPKGWHKDEDWTAHEAGYDSAFRGQMIDDLNSDYPQEYDR